MPMDNFKEEVVIKKNRGFASFLYGMTWVFMVLFAILGFFTLNILLSTIGGEGGFDWVSLIISLVLLGTAVLMWLKKDTLRVEYEYTFTNGTLDVAMVLNNNKRRYLTELNLRTVEACGHVAHPSFNRFVNGKDVKKHNWFLNRDRQLFYFYFVKNNVKHLMVIEPSDEMVEMFKQRNYLNFGVFQG